MKAPRRFSTALAMVACWGLVIPIGRVQSTEVATVPQPFIDVQLDGTGAFTGTIVDSSGNVMRSLRVDVIRQGQAVYQSATDDQGRFSCSLNHSGTYQLVAAQQMVQLRCWASNSGPPHAQQHIPLVLGRVERGQNCTESSCTTPECQPTMGSRVLGFVMHPIVIGTAIAAAIAIPLALDDDDDDDAS